MSTSGSPVLTTTASYAVGSMRTASMCVLALLALERNAPHSAVKGAARRCARRPRRARARALVRAKCVLMRVIGY
jgi:hypothetical protein